MSNKANNVSLDYLVVVQANLHKKKECNTDLVLHTDFLLKSHHIDSKNQVVLGMKAYNKKWKHKPKNKGSGSMQAESPSSGPSDHSQAGRSQPSSTGSRHPAQLQSSLSSHQAMASFISMPDIAPDPETPQRKATSKDPLYQERKKFQRNIRNYIKTGAKLNGGCCSCPTSCQPDSISKFKVDVFFAYRTLSLFLSQPPF